MAELTLRQYAAYLGRVIHEHPGFADEQLGNAKLVELHPTTRIVTLVDPQGQYGAMAEYTPVTLYVP